MVRDNVPPETGEPSLTFVDDDRLVEPISRAARTVVLLAPGVSSLVATALADAWKRLGRDSVTVVLDVDPEVCRLGMGTMEGLRVLEGCAHEMGALVGHQPGVRIGVLIVDGRALVFGPTPLLVEAGTHARSDRMPLRLRRCPSR